MNTTHTAESIHRRFIIRGWSSSSKVSLPLRHPLILCRHCPVILGRTRSREYRSVSASVIPTADVDPLATRVGRSDKSMGNSTRDIDNEPAEPIV